MSDQCTKSKRAASPLHFTQALFFHFWSLPSEVEAEVVQHLHLFIHVLFLFTLHVFTFTKFHLPQA